jgi:hypothetical protein
MICFRSPTGVVAGTVMRWGEVRLRVVLCSAGSGVDGGLIAGLKFGDDEGYAGEGLQTGFFVF